ncbi:MAG: hypothetical protein R3D31_08295 [Hyphomicrobiaceae bacterium]
MTLGALLARLESHQDAAAALEALRDLPLYAEVAAMAERFGETPAEYVALGAARFANGAGDEDWLALIAAMERADDPGQAALQRLVRWAIAKDRAELSPSCEHTCAGSGAPAAG